MRGLVIANGVCAHYVMVSKFQWKPFWLATQRDPQNDWTATQNRVNYDVFAQAPLVNSGKCFDCIANTRFRRGKNFFQNIRQRRERNGGEAFRPLSGFISRTDLQSRMHALQDSEL